MVKKKLTKAKAKKILKEGVAKGHKLTQKQRGMFGIIASGRKLTKLKRKK